jgi:hypothetical protein
LVARQHRNAGRYLRLMTILAGDPTRRNADS